MYSSVLSFTKYCAQEALWVFILYTHLHTGHTTITANSFSAVVDGAHERQQNMDIFDTRVTPEATFDRSGMTNLWCTALRFRSCRRKDRT